MSKTILCIASYEKGQAFLRQAKKEGWKVLLLTSKSLENADWPKDSIDDIYYIPDVNKEWKMDDVINGVSFLARSVQIDRIVALDDFDVEKAAALREHLRVPGMGDTTARYFRDKLAMRMKAREAGITVPDFVGIINYEIIREFLSKVTPSYVLKPRLQAGATGIRKIHAADDLWKNLEELGDRQSFYLLEKFIPGEIFHVDSILVNKQILFSIVSKYGLPPMEVAHEGRVFTTCTIPIGSDDETALQQLNKSVLPSLGLLHGVSHTEYIKGKEDGKFYFLETSARVGGAHIVDLIEAATGMNLWAEWAKLEIANNYSDYKPVPLRNEYAGLIVSLAKQEYPDMSAYNDPEIFLKIKKLRHAGLVLRSEKFQRIEDLIKNYTERFYNDFFASAPPKDKPNF
ncbi:MAG: ATP-grasp domain-containing protein [Ignavibacteriales bacterium]|nr:ATP-grasp domain-containing protein [Ignavibacteriales bacterium]